MLKKKVLGKDLWYSREQGQFKIRIGKDCKKALEMKNPSSKNTAFIFSIWRPLDIAISEQDVTEMMKDKNETIDKDWIFRTGEWLIRFSLITQSVKAIRVCFSR